MGFLDGLPPIVRVCCSRPDGCENGHQYFRHADAVAKKGSDDDDDDDDLRTEDDVEADLDSILKEKLTAADDTPLDDEEEDGVVVDDKTDGMERLQPRRPDETQCTQCFLLVRNSAPGCPVEDDACPLFK